MKPRFFRTAAEFRAWLEKNHNSAKQLLVGYYKKGSGQPSITWPESVDEALCFGWIDGVRRSLGDEAYTIRFTPRRAGSIWSAVNIGRVAELTKLKQMRPAGLTAFARRIERKSRVYTYEQKNEAVLGKALATKFKANEKAWQFFQLQAPYYRKLMTVWLNRAKGEDTRQRRLDKLIAACESGRRLVP